MTKFKLFYLFIFFQTYIFGQSKISPIEESFDTKNIPEKIKKIIQYKSDTILNIREFDSSKNLIFSHSKEYIGPYWNNKYITTIHANIYDSNNKKIKSYYLHSNVGICLDYFEYDENGFQKNVYSKNNDFEDNEDQINTNPYSFIFKIESLNDLINNEKINRIEEIATKFLQLEKEYDSIGNLISEISFNSLYKRNNLEKFVYDNANNLIYSYLEDSDNNSLDFIYNYSENKLIQKLRISPIKNSISKEVDFIEFYIYDNKNRLIEEIVYEKGKMKYKYFYEYNEINLVKKIITYLYNFEKPTIVEKYYYNKKRNVTKEKIYDYRSNEKIINKYSYFYEYYK